MDGVNGMMDRYPLSLFVFTTFCFALAFVVSCSVWDDAG
jgi:hypothetical protein